MNKNVCDNTLVLFQFHKGSINTLLCLHGMDIL